MGGKKRTNTGGKGFMTAGWTTFVPDLRTGVLDPRPEKGGPGGLLTGFTMASWGGVHASEWPVGRYHKAHYHGPGIILLGLNSEGYALVWLKEYGPHPYQDGHGDKVIRAPWKPGGI